MPKAYGQGDKRKVEGPTRTFTVRDMPVAERPRERLSRLGPEALSAAELLALVLGRGVKGESVVSTSQKLLGRFGDLPRVLNAHIEELCSLTGVGPAKAAQLKAVLEISRRLEKLSEAGPSTVVKGPDEAVREVRPQLKGLKRERFVVLLLDIRNHLLQVDPVSTGSLDTSIVHPREVFKEAIRASAASVILVHNHPSGDPQPSQEDIQLTRRLVEAGKLMGIDVLDHIVVCDTTSLSMKAKGLM